LTRLAHILEAKGTNARRLAEASGIPARTVYHHARGETRPTLVQAAAYAKALEVPLEELLEEPAA
jgi:transcriptional regulator with XRE-family HTH domain